MFKKTISSNQAGGKALTRYHGTPPWPVKKALSNSSPADITPKAGRFETLTPRPGLEITLTDLTRSAGLKLKFDIDEAPVNLSFTLNQPVRTTLALPRGRLTLDRRPGNCLFAWMPVSRGVTETPPGRFSGLSIQMTLPVFRELFPGLPEKVGISPSFFAGSAGPLHRILPLAWETRLALAQMIDCPYAGDSRRIFFEAKTLEVITRTLEEMGSRSPKANTCLSAGDLERTREAHQILISSMETPPGLQALCTMVGLNRNKLTQGFKTLYGGTVFSVLRDARLTLALALLRDTEASLADIALRVGYSDQANFSNAFRRRFGMSPKTIRQNGADMAGLTAAAI